MNVLFIGASSVGPKWIMYLLKKSGHKAFGIFIGYKDIAMGEMAVPFLPSVDRVFLQNKKIDIVGLSVDSFNIEQARFISARIKEDKPGIKIIWGGIHPTVEPDECISCPEVDYICLGEGEYPMLELCSLLQNFNEQTADTNIKNIWAKKDNKIFKNELREYVDVNIVDFDREDTLYNAIYTSRGCAGNCTFCMLPYLKTKLGIKGSYFRNRRVDLVMQDIREMIKANNMHLFKKLFFDKLMKDKVKVLLALYRYNIEPIRIKDDSFLLNKEWFFEFAKEFSKKFKKRGYICSARIQDINEKVVEALRKSNCRMIVLGFESGDQNYRNQMLNKQITDIEIYRAAKLLKNAGIAIVGQWMIGMPGESIDQALKSLKMSMEIGDIPQVHIATPLPKTEMRERALGLGFLSNDTKISVKGIYEDFLMVPKDQINAFRLLYNIFMINNQKLKISKRSIFERFYYEIRKIKNAKIGKIVTQGIKLHFEK